MSVLDAFRGQAANCQALGSPFMARLMTLAADRLTTGTPVADQIFSWSGDASANADNVPLRLAGALHALRLRNLALADVYPPNECDDDTLWAAVERAMENHSGTILTWLQNPPQTNEVRRAATILPALAWINSRFDRPIELLELGASAGLNLRCDKFLLKLPDGFIGDIESPVVLEPEWTGPMPPTKLPLVVRRAGVDLAPLDPAQPDDRLRLLSYLWADQPERHMRTRAAMDIAQATPAELSCGDAGEWLSKELARPSNDRVRVVFHTVAWQYFPPDTRAAAENAMRNAAGDLARIEMEYDGGRGASVRLTVWPDRTSHEIARADFHGRWIEWHDDQALRRTGPVRDPS